MTAKGVTSAPVPDVVGMQTSFASSPSLGNWNARLRTSKNFSLRSLKLTSGCSYMSHMTLAASMGDPPPTAMIVSGRKARSTSAPLVTVWMLGSGSTLSMICSETLLGRRCSTSMTLSTMPMRVMVASVMIVTRSTSFMDRR